MAKIVYMYISIALFAGSLYVSLFNNNKYLKTLNDKESEHRKKVVVERMRIYLIANMSALLLTSILLYNDIRLKNSLQSSWMYTAIYFLTEYFVYSLYPKKYWMLQSVENNQDALDWLEKYKFMKRNWHIGLLLGILSVLIFTYYYFDDDKTIVYVI